MTIANKLTQLNQVKQDIKQAIEDKGVDTTGVPFTDYPEKINDISSGDLTWEDFPLACQAYNIYGLADKLELFPNAWESMSMVNPNEIEADELSSGTHRGRVQYPSGEVEGVIIPDDVTRIGTWSFGYWDSNNQPLVIPNSVTSIGLSAFRDWTSNNQPLVIPGSVTDIGNYVFDGWTSNNQPLVISDGVTNIGDFAFGGWTSNNQPLVIPGSVTDMGSGPFRDWTSNNQPLVISDGVTNIGNSAFREWRSNTHPLVIPGSVTNIGNYAFYRWIRVPYVELKATVPPSLGNSNAFANQRIGTLDPEPSIYVPDESVNDYKTATNWVSFAWRIKPMSEKP